MKKTDATYASLHFVPTSGHVLASGKATGITKRRALTFSGRVPTE